jgi:hypothetical protein
MKSCIPALIFFLFPFISLAGDLHGRVKNDQQQLLPFASIIIKNKNIGTTANAQGFYKLELKPGKYIVICQHIGYAVQEKEIEITNANVELDFVLSQQQYNLNAVTVRSGAEDPAYAIIRKAIKERNKYKDEYKRFECEVYLKGRFNLRSYPKKMLGKDVDFEDGDTSQKKTVFLSETVAKYSVENDKKKVNVVSTKVSGDSDGFGFSFPQVFSFYEEIIKIGSSLNPRGFISPISDNALNYYNYKFRGTFFQDGVEVSRIEIIPKRKYEPVFKGFIDIIENSWRIHSVDVTLLKEQQMQLVDTLVIQQLYVLQNKNWFLRQQVLSPAIKIFSFDAYGSFVQVYDKFDLDPKFPKGYFNNTILKFEDSATKKSISYWDSIRPIPLQPEEIADYKKKDTLEQKRKDPAYLDSLDKKSNKIKISEILLTGKTFQHQSKKSTLSIPAVRQMINYNTVEGGVVNFSPVYFKRYTGRKSLMINPTFRYGFSNEHTNADVNVGYSFGKKYLNHISIAGGSRVFEFNNDAPDRWFRNSISTLFWKENNVKFYEAGFVKASFTKGLGEGLTVTTDFQFQNRTPLENTSFHTWRNIPEKEFTPNYPFEIMSSNMPSHQATSIGVNINWQPGAKYIEFPDRKINIGSKYPTFHLRLTQGIKDLFSSDVDYTKWRFGITDNIDLKLGGQLRYNIATGGFLNKKNVYVPDFKHYNANIGVVAADYLMPVLHNRVSNEELKQRLMEEFFPENHHQFLPVFPGSESPGVS